MENPEARALARNIRLGSGNHGLTEDQLYEIFKHSSQITQLAYSLKKCAELSGKEFFITQDQSIARPSYDQFTRWHHIDEQWDNSWGFAKAHPGCYVYGIFDLPPNNDPADFLSSAVIYIGESRAVTRNCMLGRRTDFKGTVRNERLSPYGCGTAFKENFGKDMIDQCYQAYLPMHPSFCKSSEINLLSQYYLKYNKIPVCNPPLDLVRVKKHLKEKENV